METYNVLGVMSGTSLDGVDIAYVKFSVDNNEWKYELLDAKIIPYSEQMRTMLIKANEKSAIRFSLLHTEYGRYLGKLLKYFIEENKLEVDFISSHGHTIFHHPEKKLTVQIGNGAAIAAISNYPVVCNFRTTDIALNGQGAPLVPIGDKYLFREYDYCLNLGGIANISYENNRMPSMRVGGDIVPVNIVLNYLAQQKKLPYDKDGENARNGSIDATLLQKLNALKFYTLSFPKSLGKELITEEHILELFTSKISIEDKLRTVCEHIAFQVGKIIFQDQKNSPQHKKMLVTGGGAFNKFLIELLREKCPVEVIVPDENIVNFKEAIIFGFLGVLRMRGEINCLKSVTGALRDSCGGAVYL
jgi:anhydro-N-acetylmuramic acid kinase